MIKSQELVEEFYRLNKEKYPDRNFNQIKEACYNPWQCLHQEMASGRLTKIRFKYFGVFQVYKGRAEAMLKSIQKRFKAGKMMEVQYNEIKKMLEKYLKTI